MKRMIMVFLAFIFLGLAIWSMEGYSAVARQAAKEVSLDKIQEDPAILSSIQTISSMLTTQHPHQVQTIPKSDSIVWHTWPNWICPPLRVCPDGARTLTLMVINLSSGTCSYSVSCNHPCIQLSGGGEIPSEDSVTISGSVHGTGDCVYTFVYSYVILETDVGGGTVDSLMVHAVVSDEYQECPVDPETYGTISNGVLTYYTNSNCESWLHYYDAASDTTYEVFSAGGTIVALTDGAGDTLVGRFMREDWRAGSQQKLYTEECASSTFPFYTVWTSESYIQALHLAPPLHYKWWWFEVAKQVKMFTEEAPDPYKHFVVEYVTVAWSEPPTWWPDQSPFAGHEEVYIGVAEDIDCPAEEYDGQSARNYAGYDEVNRIAWQEGSDSSGTTAYPDFYAGIALGVGRPFAPGGPVPEENTQPYGTHSVRNDVYLYPQDGWGWNEGELYLLASASGNHIDDAGLAVDRSLVFTATQIPASTSPPDGRFTTFTLIKAVAPDGLSQLQTYVDTARSVITRDRENRIPMSMLCGDVTRDGIVDVSDIVYLITYLFKGGYPTWQPVPCPGADGDVNGDEEVSVGDITKLIGFFFKLAQPVWDYPRCPGVPFYYIQQK